MLPRELAMSRHLSACIILVASGVAGSAPKLKDLPAGDYFPTTVGDRWVTEMQYKSGTSEYTEVVTAVEKKDGGLVVTVGRESDGKLLPQTSDVRVTNKGLFRMSLLGTMYDEPYCILKLPLKPGESWTSQVSSGGTVTSTFKYKAIKEETVEVPAGKFKAFRIEVEIDNRGQPAKSVIWYDARLGAVKMEHDSGDSSYMRVLKSFKPGGK
jgi:hypothetical protein